MKPRWLEIATNEIGTQEVPGRGNNRRIVEYHATTSLKATSDDVPWCSSFVNWCMEIAGIKGTDSAAARSWLKWGEELKIPQLGCVVIMKRGDNPQSGHVCFFTEDLGDKIRCLGGNQSDQVKLSVYAKADVLGYRWPIGE